MRRNEGDIESLVTILTLNNYLNELLSNVIICLLFELINFCLPFSSKTFKNFLVPAITYKTTILYLKLNNINFVLDISNSKF